jgi:hypothetical protein
MKIGTRDWIFIALIAAIGGIFWAISGEVKTKMVPSDDTHKKYYEAFRAGTKKIELDKDCPSCHNEQGGVPFPKDHPLKPQDGPMRCLFCHKFKNG